MSAGGILPPAPETWPIMLSIHDPELGLHNITLTHHVRASSKTIAIDLVNYYARAEGFRELFFEVKAL